QVGAAAETFGEAQTICKSFGASVASVHNAKENSFLRRLAVSRGLVNGVMLGASSNGQGNNFGWVDGSKWDYDNFVPGFPMAGLGDCVAMDTSSSTGQWVNTVCSAPLPFVCSRKTSDKEPVCGAASPKEGDVIYSPGFPNDASKPCDFFLGVEAGKRVEVEVLFLEANSCCDHLVLLEGSIGGNIIANLTGEIGTSRTFTTGSSNLMRASWQPHGGLNVRGMMVSSRV
ncbi:hypothetical protein PFISCL1PPCAC_13211, partial [Pristionchus fissidentatus]